MSEYILKENEDGTVITVRDVQNEILEILLEFDRITKAHNLDYVLAYGTELGAVRHGGFIPWDDDIDLFMERADYLKLVSILDAELSNKFYFQCYETNDKYNTLTPAMKIKMHGTHIEERTWITNRLKDNGLFIDIFLFEGISESKFKHYVAQCYSILLMPFIIVLDKLNIDSRFFTKKLYNHAQKYHDKYQHSKFGALNVSWTFNGFTYTPILKSHVFPSREIEFEGHKLRGSQNPHEVLKYMYGENYMTPPNIKYQVPHHIVKIEVDKED